MINQVKKSILNFVYHWLSYYLQVSTLKMYNMTRGLVNSTFMRSKE